MTSIEFLFNELWESPKDKLTWHTILNKAKEMHKHEIIDTYLLDELDSGKKYAEQYYQETFVSNGTDEHIVDTNEMISEDKMLTEATNRYVIENEIEAFIQGANWMEEQLKNETKI